MCKWFSLQTSYLSKVIRGVQSPVQNPVQSPVQLLLLPFFIKGIEGSDKTWTGLWTGLGTQRITIQNYELMCDLLSLPPSLHQLISDSATVIIFIQSLVGSIDISRNACL